MTDSLVVLCTVPSDEVAESLARALLERRLVGCANILPGVKSLYRWQGKVESDAELLMVLKTTRERYAALEVAIGELHPYDTPEVLALPVEHGAGSYLAWLGEQVAPD